jgi:hypothetical protein
MELDKIANKKFKGIDFGRKGNKISAIKENKVSVTLDIDQS